MSRLAFLLMAAAAASTAYAAANNDHYSEFVAWTRKYGKLYSGPEEHVKRFLNYQNNYDLVKSLNSFKSGATFSLNKFADMSLPEFADTYLSVMRVPENARRGMRRLPANPFKAYPETLDWRNNGAVNSVKDQASCGSCWAFSAVANLEGAYFVAHNELPRLSEQQLVDCDHGCMIIDNETSCNSGCDGGLPIIAFQYALQNGMMTESDYAYTGVGGTCNYDAKKATYKFSDAVVVDENEDAMVTALNEYGPLSVGVDATFWSFYTSGIYDSFCSSSTLNHGVALIGYGTQGTTNYWIIRNSWGSSWGESGYMRIVRGKNKCGINSLVSTIIP